MDPDSELKRASTKVSRFLLITFFASCEYNQADSKSNTTARAALAKDSVVVKQDTVQRHSKTIYLTFDDGPNRGSNNVLKAATEEQIPITMFLIGQHISASPGQMYTYQNITKNPLVEIQNHSYTHAHNHFEKFYMRPDLVNDDFVRCSDSLHLLSNIIRTPGRNIWRTSNISFTDVKKTSSTGDSLQKRGFNIVGWDVEWRFDNHLKLLKTDEELVRQIGNLFEDGKTKTPNHLVLLAHDQTFSDSANFANLRRFFKELKNTGEYNFEVISKYPNLKNNAVKNDTAILK